MIPANEAQQKLQDRTEFSHNCQFNFSSGLKCEMFQQQCLEIIVLK